jgi:integrase
MPEAMRSPASPLGHPGALPAPAMPTRAQARQALQAAAKKDPELYLFLRLEATTGLRPGEVCALWWQNFDLEAGDLVVGYNVVHARGLPGGYVRKRTKSRHGDDRPIALGKTTTRLLEDHRARCEARAHDWGHRTRAGCLPV